MSEASWASRTELSASSRVRLLWAAPLCAGCQAPGLALRGGWRLQFGASCRQTGEIHFSCQDWRLQSGVSCRQAAEIHLGLAAPVRRVLQADRRDAFQDFIHFLIAEGRASAVHLHCKGTGGSP